MFLGFSRAASNDGPRSVWRPRVKTAGGAALLRSLQLLLLAIATIVGVGVATPSAVVASVAHPARLAAIAPRHIARSMSARTVGRIQDSAARPAIDRDSVLVDVVEDELDDVDDDDIEHRSSVTHLVSEATLHFRSARLSRRPDLALRGHPQFDRPRFRTGRGLLRGPPA